VVASADNYYSSFEGASRQRVSSSSIGPLEPNIERPSEEDEEEEDPDTVPRNKGQSRSSTSESPSDPHSDDDDEDMRARPIKPLTQCAWSPIFLSASLSFYTVSILNQPIVC
jgi:hypothetical protein